LLRAVKKSFLYLVQLAIAVNCCDQKLHAQNDQYSISVLTPANGMASSDVTSIYQDSKKYLWIAHAAGISRYDGTFHNYMFSGETRLGRAFCIVEQDDKFWIGAEGGLFMFANNVLKFISFPGKILPVYSISPDRKKGLWLCTSDGPAYIDETDIAEMINKESFDIMSEILPQWKNHFPIGNISVGGSLDHTGNFFLTDGIAVYKISKDSLDVLWTKTGRRDEVTGIAAGKKDEIFFTTAFSGLHKIVDKNHFEYSNNFGNGNDVIRYKGIIYYYATKGVYTLDEGTDNLIPLVILPEEYWEWGSAIFPGNENNFWIGTHEKLLQARKKLFSDPVQSTVPGFDEVYSILQLKNGDLVCGLHRGKIFSKKNTAKEFSFQTKLFADAPVTAILETDSGDVWYASAFQGIAITSKHTSKTFTRKEGLRDNTNFFFLYTKSKQIYTGGDNGVTRISKDQNGKVSFTNFELKTGSNHYPIFRTAIEKPNGSLLFGGNFGLYELKNDSLQQVSITNSTKKNIYVTDMAVSSNGHVWISTMGDGILMCDFSNEGLKLLKQFTEKDGLSSMIYLDLLMDRNGNLWAAGHAGITRLTADKIMDVVINNFDQTHGYISDNYHTVKMSQAADGLIWIATSSGLFHFDPSQSENFSKSLSVEIRGVRTEDNKNLDAYSEETNGTNLSKKYSLPYDINDLHIEFGSIDLSDPSSVRYRYRLVGSDSNWIDAGNIGSLNFRNLDPGHYIFEVKAASTSNQWSDPARIEFNIRPPVWTQWWFIGSVILAIFTATVFAVKRREKKIKQQEAEKTELQKLKAISYQYKLEIEQVTNFFATSISKQKTVDDILWDVAKNCISKLGFEDCVIYLNDDSGTVLVQKAAWGPKTTAENRIINPIEIPVGKGIVGSVAASGKPVIINDTSIDQRYIVDDIRRDAEIAVPLIRGGEVIGVIDCEHCLKYFYNDKHLQILTTIASLSADRISKVIAEQQARDKEVEVFKLNQDLATSQLTALRSQMNPHFIFNSLNSIAQLVASRQNEEGLQYLTKFSKLLRLVLDESGNNFINLKDEVKILDLYLQLETLRFDSSFAYTIHIDNSLDEEDLMLPSFLIHPIVENAVWHGLLHKAGERRLIINFIKKTEEQLHCIIKDNGIGIDAATVKRKEQLNGEIHHSKGLKLVSERLELLQQQYGIETFMITEDMKDGDFDSGTKVTIQLPLIYE
jgi:ligand-binding sensor domain-containing protein/putative methionine-R-sulfoxide reductase with GAF domain